MAISSNPGGFRASKIIRRYRGAERTSFADGVFDRVRRARPVARARAKRAVVAKADARATDLAPVFERLDPNGSLSLNEMARRLTAEGLPTVNGSAQWSAAGVARVRSRLAVRA